jgi:hypothetical protein
MLAFYLVFNWVQSLLGRLNLLCIWYLVWVRGGIGYRGYAADGSAPSGGNPAEGFAVRFDDRQPITFQEEKFIVHLYY